MRVIVSNSLSVMILLYSEIMQQAETGETSVEKQVHVDIVTLEGRSALQFSSKQNERFAWVFWSDEVPGFVVWYANEGEYICNDQDYVMPDFLSSHAITLSFSHNVINSINDFIVDGIIPDDTMPRGHMASITKFN